MTSEADRAPQGADAQDQSDAAADAAAADGPVGETPWAEALAAASGETIDPEEALVVDIEGYEGPLDLLLALARTQKVDLAKLSILALVEQYLAFIAEAQRLRLELAADYLVMAAWLAFLKSRLLLPREEKQGDTMSAEEAAQRLSMLHKRSGSEGVLKFLDACYRTHTIATNFSAALEGCMAQDYVHSRVLVAVYARVPEAVRAERKLPSPEAIAGAMNSRFAAIFEQYKLKPNDVEALQAAFETHGVPIFVKSAFPGTDATGGDKAK